MAFSLDAVSFREIVERTPNGVIIVEATGTIVMVNDKITDWFGYSKEELLGNSVDMLVPESVHGYHHKNRSSFIAQGHSRSFDAEAGLHGRAKDGTLIPVEIGLVPLDLEIGKHILVSVVNISERRRHENVQETLIRELSHRVKNNMALVGSIATMTRKHTNDIDTFFRAFSGRINALAGAHDLIASKNWTNSTARSIIRQVTAPFDPLETRIRVEGPVMTIPAEHVATVTMVFHELTTNALKYGALSNPKGYVDVKWSVKNDFVDFCWLERDGPPVVRPTHKGFGTTLIERTCEFTFEGSVRMEYLETGFECYMKTPVIGSVYG